MDNELVSYEAAKLAKEKGCELDLYTDNEWEYEDEDSNTFYCNFKPTDSSKKRFNLRKRVLGTQSLLQRWLREKHNIHIHVNWVYKKSYDTDVDWYYDVKGIGLVSNNLIDLDETKFNSYEEALEKGLKEALKLLP